MVLSLTVNRLWSVGGNNDEWYFVITLSGRRHGRARLGTVRWWHVGVLGAEVRGRGFEAPVPGRV